MNKIKHRFLKEELEGTGDNPLSRMEIIMFKHINNKKKSLKNANELLEEFKVFMKLISKPESDARFYYEIYTANYRPEGDYENLTRDNFKDYRSFKQKRTPNNDAYSYSRGKIPFKGSNLEGYWDINRNGDWYYVIKSYGWYPIFLFINNKWYGVSNTYSISTSKHISQTHPTKYNSGLGEKVIYVTRDEMDDLLYGLPFEEIKSGRPNKFFERISERLIGNRKTISFGYDDEKKKVDYTIKNIELEDNKIKFNIKINKAGKVEGFNRMVVNPEGYVVPSPFSDDIENGISRKIINDWREYLSDDNTIFIFEH